MSAPVVVDPAPTDLATGLEDLAGVLTGGVLGGGGNGGPVLLVAADLALHPEALADLALDPRPSTAVLVSRAGAIGTAAPPAGHDLPAPDLRVRAGRVMSVATAVHAVPDPDAWFVGALRVAAADRAAAADVALRLAGAARRLGWSGDPLGYLVLGLVRTGVAVGAVSVDPWLWGRGGGVPGPGAERQAALRAELAAMTPAAAHVARLARAGKAEDGPVATVLSRPLSRRVTPWALRLGLTPNQVTLISVVVGLGAAALFALGHPVALVAGALALQLSLVLDCVDGDVARYCRSFTPLGAWLDASTDRLKEFACYLGLAFGAGAGRTGWLLAAAMITLQTTRHAVDYTFTTVKDLRESAVPVADLEDVGDPADRGSVGSAAAARVIELSRRSSASRPALTVVKKLLHLGIGERWLVLSVLAAAGRPVGALATLLALGAVSLLYTTAGRTLRTRSWAADPVSPREHEVVAAQVDGGPLLPTRWAAAIAGGPGGRARFRWARPALLRTIEYAGLLAATAVLPGAGVGAAVALLLLVVAAHHYDDLYRVLNRLRPPSAASRILGLGWPGRLLAVGLLSVLAAGDGPGGRLREEGGLWVLVAGLGMLFLVVEPVRVLREVRQARGTDGVRRG